MGEKNKGEIGMQQLTAKEIPDHIRSIYKKNPFMADFFHVHIDEIQCGSATVSIHTEVDKHANHRGIIHGGVMAALADSVLGVTGASMGCVVVTVNMNVSYLKNTIPGATIYAHSRVLHCGRTTMVINASIIDSRGVVLGDRRPP